MLLALLSAAALVAPQPATAAPAEVPLQFRYDKAVNLYRERRTVMTGNPVVLTRGDAVLYCKKLTLDNDERDDLQRATCVGDVRLTRGTRILTCLTAVYEKATALVTCKGEANLEDGRSRMACDEVAYDLAQDQVTGTKCKGTLYEEPGKGFPIRRRGGKP